jgi:hypothetical protein
MVYNNAIPNANDPFSVSQPQIKANFAQIATAFNVDHEDFNAVNEGKHAKVTFPEQASDPTTSSNEVAIYSKDDGSGNTRVYYRPPSNGTVYQLTGPDPSAATNGYSYLPGGLLLQWGQHTTTNTTSQTISFNTNFSATAYNVSVTYEVDSNSSNVRNFVNVQEGTISNSGFTANSRDRNGVAIPASKKIHWIAIGPA